MEVGGWLQGPMAGRRHPASVLRSRRAPRPGGGTAWLHRPLFPGPARGSFRALSLLQCGSVASCVPKMARPTPDTHTHTHTQPSCSPYYPSAAGGVWVGVCACLQHQCDGLRAVTGQARTGRDGASRDSSRFGSPPWEPPGCLEALSTWKSRVQASQSWAPPGGRASGSQPYGGSSDPQGKQTPAHPRRRL